MNKSISSPCPRSTQREIVYIDVAMTGNDVDGMPSNNWASMLLCFSNHISSYWAFLLRGGSMSSSFPSLHVFRTRGHSLCFFKQVILHKVGTHVHLMLSHFPESQPPFWATKRGKIFDSFQHFCPLSLALSRTLGLLLRKHFLRPHIQYNTTTTTWSLAARKPQFPAK